MNGDLRKKGWTRVWLYQLLHTQLGLGDGYTKSLSQPFRVSNNWRTSQAQSMALIR
jgi:hypothetical protein